MNFNLFNNYFKSGFCFGMSIILWAWFFTSLYEKLSRRLDRAEEDNLTLTYEIEELKSKGDK